MTVHRRVGQALLVVVAVPPLAVLLSLAGGPAAAQAPAGSSRTLADLGERLKAYTEEVEVRRGLLLREADTVTALSDAGDSISSFATSAPYSRALGKLDDARRAALTEPALPEPFPSVVAEVGQHLNRVPPGTSPTEVRGRLFVITGRLQEALAQSTETARRDERALQAILSSIWQVQGGLRSSAVIGLKAAVHAQVVAAQPPR